MSPLLPPAAFSSQDIPPNASPRSLTTLLGTFFWLNHRGPSPNSVYGLKLLLSHAADNLASARRTARRWGQVSPKASEIQPWRPEVLTRLAACPFVLNDISRETLSHNIPPNGAGSGLHSHPGTTLAMWHQPPQLWTPQLCATQLVRWREQSPGRIKEKPGA